MTDMMRLLLAREGKKCVALSLDDFYLTGADQDALAASHEGNALLKLRGNAGSHDMAIMNEIMGSFAAGSRNVLVPRYDKSLRSGRGDRAPVQEWELVEDVDVVIFEVSLPPSRLWFPVPFTPTLHPV